MYFASIILIITFVVGQSGSYVTSGPKDDKIIFVQMVYRHGDRAPVCRCVKDCSISKPFWTSGWGSLSELGRIQQQNFGKWIGERYGNDLFGNKFTKDDIYVTCTNSPRTYESAANNLKGLKAVVPFSGKDIEIQKLPKMTEMGEFGTPCRAYDVEFNKVFGEEVKKLNEENQNMLKYLSDNLGTNITTVIEAAMLFDHFKIENIYGSKLPEWTQSVFPGKLEELYKLYFELGVSNNFMRRLAPAGGGIYLKEMVENIKQKIQGKETRKMIQFSSHDLIVSSVVNALMRTRKNPFGLVEYTGAVIIETLENEQKELFVRVLYKRDANTDTAEVLHIPGCSSEKCTIHEFITSTAEVRPDDWSYECDLERNTEAKGMSVINMWIQGGKMCELMFQKNFVPRK